MFSIGADPELFVGVNDTFVSAHDMIPGTKVKPFKVDKGAVQVDGMALEYNIDPAETMQEFKHNIMHVKTQLLNMVKGVEVIPRCSVEFKEEDIVGVPVTAVELGCSVDFNAYTKRANKAPDSAKLMRTAGGHVHIGTFTTKRKFNKVHLDKCIQLTRLMDKYLGVYSLIWDQDIDRRSMYGQAGCFRPCDFGVEYRTLSNMWIFKEELIEFVYAATAKAYDALLGGEVVDTDEYARVINESDLSSPILQDETAMKLRGILNV